MTASGREAPGEPVDAGDAPDAKPPALDVEGLVKDYPGVRALDEVDLRLRPGEVHALLGENGAGKSTLIRIAGGAERADRGALRVDGAVVAPRTPLEAQRLGIAVVHQEINLVPQRSVAENLCLGRLPMRWTGIDWPAARSRARSALGRLGLDLDVDRRLGACSIAQQQMVAIARALEISAGAAGRVLILDEPTSSLDAGEVRRLFDVMRQLRADGHALLFVTHFIGQVYEVADRITVLRNGRRVGTWATGDLPRVELVRAMLGRALDDAAPPTRRDEAASGPPVIEVDGLRRRRAVGPLRFAVRRGEVLGLAGLLGSGRTEAARLLFGLDRADGGAVRSDGRRVHLRGPRDAIRRGLGFLPEDRQREGIFPHLSVRENIVLALQARRGWRRRLGRTAQRRIAARYLDALRIAAVDADRPVRTLSGGNQQKVLLARWLALDPRLLILDEPTRGVDVGARSEIERLVEGLRRNGMAFVLVSSELDEIARLADRAVVLRDRAQAAVLDGPLAVDRLHRAIAGAAAAEPAP